MSTDHHQEELTTPTRCTECAEITAANDETCVHCGAKLSKIVERKPVDKHASLEGVSQPASDELPIRTTYELSSDANYSSQSSKMNKKPEPDCVGIRVEKSESHEASKEEKRRRYGELECPFDKGDTLYLEIKGESKRLRLVELAFSTQLATGFFAADLDDPAYIKCEENDVRFEPSTAPYFFEVYVSGHAPISNLSSSQCQLFRTPVGSGRYKGKPFRVYDEGDSLSLETFVEQAKRKLPLNEIVALYRAILDLAICAHSQKSLVFGISPWTVRILNNSEDCETCRIYPEDLEEEEDDSTLVPLLNGKSEKPEEKQKDVCEDDLTFELDESYHIPSMQETPTAPMKTLGDEATNTEDLTFRAVFDGLETLYPMDEMPESIPLITGFAASEFLLGVTQMVGPQADIFSLGALLFYLVTGHVPPSSIHTQYAPALPMRNFRPDFPPGLEAVVQRATRIDPSERYNNVRQLRNDFEHAVAQIRQRETDQANKKNYSVVRAAVDKHIGIAKGKRMPLNQDSVFCGVVETGRLALVVIADGVTRATYGRGDIASKFVTDAAEIVWKDIEEEYVSKNSFDPFKAINRILTGANDRLVDYVNKNYYPFSGGLHEVMGSTVIVACVEDGLVTLATLGDSRAYLFTDIGLEQLTVDHNLWTLNVLEGAVPVDRVRSMPFADALARCVGSFRVVEQRLEALPPEPDIHQFYLRSGDRLLISTDGLTDYVGINRDSVEDAIHSVLRREPDPALAALELILLANRGGGGDNIGIGVIDFH